jgi:Flp pilus assembly protein TadG
MIAIRTLFSPLVRLVSASARRCRVDARGATAVEFAVITPVLALFFGLAADGGLMIFGQMSIEGASRAGADYAAIHGNSSGVTTAADGATAWTVTVSTTTYCGCPTSTGISQLSCTTSTCTNGNKPGNYLAVTVNSNYTPLFGGFLSPTGSATLSHTTVARTS